MTLKPRPSRPTPGQLKKAGVTLLDQNNLSLRCDDCGSTWSPDLQPGGHLPRGYWHCPKGCNTPQAKSATLLN